MQVASWDRSQEAPSFLAFQWQKLRAIPFWWLLLATGPMLMAIIGSIVVPKVFPYLLPLLFSVFSLIRAGTLFGKLHLDTEAQRLYEDNRSEAVPVGIEISSDSMPLGEDEAVLLRRGNALTFTGARCRFVLYRDNLTAVEQWRADKGIRNSLYPGEIVLRLENGPRQIRVKIVQRSSGDFSSESDRIQRVIREWQACEI